MPNSLPNLIDLSHTPGNRRGAPTCARVSPSPTPALTPSPSPKLDTAGESGVRPLTPITVLLYSFTSIHGSR